MGAGTALAEGSDLKSGVQPWDNKHRGIVDWCSLQGCGCSWTVPGMLPRDTFLFVCFAALGIEILIPDVFRPGLKSLVELAQSCCLLVLPWTLGARSLSG